MQAEHFVEVSTRPSVAILLNMSIPPHLPSLLKLNVEQGGAAEWIRSTFQYAAEGIARHSIS